MAEYRDALQPLVAAGSANAGGSGSAGNVAAQSTKILRDLVRALTAVKIYCGPDLDLPSPSLRMHSISGFLDLSMPV